MTHHLNLSIPEHLHKWKESLPAHQVSKICSDILEEHVFGEKSLIIKAKQINQMIGDYQDSVNLLIDRNIITKSTASKLNGMIEQKKLDECIKLQDKVIEDEMEAKTNYNKIKELGKEKKLNPSSIEFIKMLTNYLKNHRFSSSVSQLIQGYYTQEYKEKQQR